MRSFHLDAGSKAFSWFESTETVQCLFEEAGVENNMGDELKRTPFKDGKYLNIFMD